MKKATVKIISVVTCLAMLMGIVMMIPVGATKIKDNYVRILDLTFDDIEGKVVLNEGENVISGYTLVYEKHSADGEAYIENGKLWITGSMSDGIWFKDLDLDGKSFYIQMKSAYLSGLDEGGWAGVAVHRNSETANICAVNTQIAMMRCVKYAADGSAEELDTSRDKEFGITPSAGGGDGYWNWAIQPTIPYRTDIYSEVSNDNSKLYWAMFSLNPVSQYAALNDYTWGTSESPRRQGEIGIVMNYNETKVSYFVDSINIRTYGCYITVDDAPFAVSLGETPVSKFTPADKQLVYALVDGAVKYSSDTVTPPADSPTKSDGETKMKVTTKSISLETNKVNAVDTTGLKWTTNINKADLDALLADSNISKVEVGTLVAPKSNLAGGFTREALDKLGANAYTDISASTDSLTVDGDSYVFEGVYDVSKEARDTEFSGIGYVKCTMTDGKVIELYSDYTTRKHCTALSDLVEFTEETDDANQGGSSEGNDNTTEPSNNEQNGEQDTSTTTEEGGCGSYIGVSAIAIVMTAGIAGICVKKRRD